MKGLIGKNIPKDLERLQTMNQVLTQEVSKLTAQNQLVSRELLRANSQISQLNQEIAEHKALSVEYKAVAARMSERQKQLSAELQKLHRVYGTRKITVKLENHNKKLIRNSFNVMTLTDQTYTRTVNQYPPLQDKSGGESDQEGEEDYSNDMDANETKSEKKLKEVKEHYYQELLRDMRGQLAESNRKIIELQGSLVNVNKKLTSKAGNEKICKSELMCELASLRERASRKEEQDRLKIQGLTQKMACKEQELKREIEEVTRKKNLQLKKLREELNRRRKESLGMNVVNASQNENTGSLVVGKPSIIEEQYSKLQALCQHKLDQAEKSQMRKDAEHAQALRNKEKEIRKLQAELRKQRESKENREKSQNQQKQDLADRKESRVSPMKELRSSARGRTPPKKYNPYLQSRVTQKDTSSKKQALKKNNESHRSRVKKEESNREREESQESLDAGAVMELKKQIQHLEKLLKKAKEN